MASPRSYTADLRAADDARLAGTHPHLHASILRILDAMAAFGSPMFVTAGVRTDAAQQALYAQGRTTPGNIVTYTDGFVTKSLHQRQIDGLGHAVDCAFLNDPWGDDQPWDLYGLMGEKLALEWGGRWAKLADRPHLQLSLSAKL